MNCLKVVGVTNESITFENGVKLYSEHIRDCCENHYLSFDTDYDTYLKIGGHDLFEEFRWLGNKWCILKISVKLLNE